MNIAFFLIPKSRIAFLYEHNTFRQGLEKMRRWGYTAIPVITKEGHYVGTVSEGDFLWHVVSDGASARCCSMKDLETLHICDILGGKYPAVRITVTMDELLESAMHQNFIPVVDDAGIFIGIVTRKDIIGYLAEQKGASIANSFPKIV